MISGRLTDGINSIDVEGKVVVGAVIDPAGRDSDVMSIAMGTGSPMSILPEAAACLGALLPQMVEDPVQRGMLMLLMVERFKSAVYGQDMKTKVVQKQATPVKEAQDDNK